MMDLFYRLTIRVLHAWARCMLELTDLVWGIGDYPDGPPALPTATDREYFALLDSEDRP